MNQWKELYKATLHWRTGPHIPQPRLVQIKEQTNPEETASNYNCQAGRQAIQVIHTEGSTDTDRVKVATYNIEEGSNDGHTKTTEKQDGVEGE